MPHRFESEPAVLSGHQTKQPWHAQLNLRSEQAAELRMFMPCSYDAARADNIV